MTSGAGMPRTLIGGASSGNAILQLTQGTPNQSAGPLGIGNLTTGTTTNILSTANGHFLAGKSAFTAIVTFSRIANTVSFDTYVGKIGEFLFLQAQSSTTANGYIYTSGGNGPTGDLSFIAGHDYAGVLTWVSGSGLRLFVRDITTGVVTAATAGSTLTGTLSGNSGTALSFGGSGTSTDPSNVLISGAVFLDRAVTVAETYELLSDPWGYVEYDLPMGFFATAAAAVSTFTQLIYLPDQTPSLPARPQQTGAAPMGPGVAATAINTVSWLPTLPSQTARLTPPNVSGLAPSNPSIMLSVNTVPWLPQTPIQVFLRPSPNVSGNAVSGPGIAATATNTVPWLPSYPVGVSRPPFQAAGPTPFVPPPAVVVAVTFLPILPVQITQPSRQTAGQVPAGLGLAATANNTVSWLPAYPAAVTQPKQQNLGGLTYVSGVAVTSANTAPWLPTFPSAVAQPQHDYSGWVAQTIITAAVLPLNWFPISRDRVSQPAYQYQGWVGRTLIIPPDLGPVAWYPMFPAAVTQPQYQNSGTFLATVVVPDNAVVVPTVGGLPWKKKRKAQRPRLGNASYAEDEISETLARIREARSATAQQLGDAPPAARGAVAVIYDDEDDEDAAIMLLLAA